VIAYTGAVAPEAIEAIGLLGESRRDVGLLCRHVGGPAACGMDRGAKTAPRSPWAATISAISKIAGAAATRLRHRHVIDGHPAALGWLGSVRGHRVEALGVEQFGQTGTINDLYRHHGIDANAILDAAEALTAGGPVRHRKMAV